MLQVPGGFGQEGRHDQDRGGRAGHALLRRGAVGGGGGRKAGAGAAADGPDAAAAGTGECGECVTGVEVG